MAESGLADILSCVFDGIEHMLARKKCPQNFRILRLVVETIVEDIIQEADDDYDLMSRLEDCAKKSRTA